MNRVRFGSGGDPFKVSGLSAERCEALQRAYRAEWRMTHPASDREPARLGRTAWLPLLG